MSKKQSTKANLLSEINLDEFRDLATHIINNNRFLQKNGKMPVALNIVGESGIGKTSFLIQLGQELGLDFVKVNLAQLEELSDLVGFPIRQFEMIKPFTEEKGEKPAAKAKEPVKKMVPVKKKITQTVTKEVTVMEEQEVDDFDIKIEKKQIFKDGKFEMADIETKIPKKVMKEVPVVKTMEVEEEVEVEELVEQVVTGEAEIIPAKIDGAIWVDEQALSEYTRQGFVFTGQKRMSYCPPEWIAGKSKGGILLLDDYTRADMRFMQATMELIDRQQYISWSLPKDWHIILSSNPDNGDYFVTTLDTAQKTRFISRNLKFSVEVWAKWAEKEGIDSRCINFMLMHPEILDDKEINARAMTNFFNAISSLDSFENSLPLIQLIGEGSVGLEVSTLFTSFINNRLDKMLNPKDILLHDNEAYIIGELRKSIGKEKDGNYRADIASVLASRIINYSLHYAENNSITDKEISRIVRLTSEPELFVNDLQYHMIKKILNGNKKKFEKMMLNQGVQKMAMK